MVTTYTWCCDQFGCLWQVSSERREEAHDWATEHANVNQHAVSLYVENAASGGICVTAYPPKAKQ